MSHEQTPHSLTPWTPPPTHIPLEWAAFIAKETEHIDHSALDADGNKMAIGDLLRLWGLPWPVVVAGYLLPVSEQVLYKTSLEGGNLVLTHMRKAIQYIDSIDEEDLFTLLHPPYDDLGAVLIGIAYHYLDLLQQSQERSYSQKNVLQMERIGGTLLNLAKRLGMWSFKRTIEDLILQLCHPEQFVRDEQEHQHISKKDAWKLKEICQSFTTFYQETTQCPITVIYTMCGIAGLRRRQQDAHTTATSEKTQLTGFDLATFDILVPVVSDCYAALGVFNQLGYIQDQLTDHIANPKLNGYSHIALGLILKPHELCHLPWLKDSNYTCQIQISTYLMQAITNYGCLYPPCYPIYMKTVLQEQEKPLLAHQVWRSEEGRVFETIQAGIVEDQTQQQVHAPIVIYDKKRQPVSLPRGATVLDFAFAQDITLSEYAVEGFVNNRKAPLERMLDAGDIVDIRISKIKQIRDTWLQKAITPLALDAIKRQLGLDNEAHKRLNPILERADYHLTRDELYDELHHVLRQYHLGPMAIYLQRLDEDTDFHYTSEWIVERIIWHISQRNESVSFPPKWLPETDKPLPATNYHLHFCGNCKPTYEQDKRIVGYLKKYSKKLVIHYDTCPHLRLYHTTSLIPMKWQLRFSYVRVGFWLEVHNRDGLILDITKCLRHYRCSLCDFQANASHTGDASIRLTIETHNDKEILEIWQALLKVSNVIAIEINKATTHPSTYERLQTLRTHYENLQESTTDEVLWNETKKNLKPRRANLKNPFDISRPPLEEMFFGRTAEMKRMQRALCEGERGRALMLYGPLRSGKSTLCKNFLKRCVHPPFWSTYYSFFEAMGQREEIILMEMAERVSDAFCNQLEHILPDGYEPPDWTSYHHPDPQIHFRQFIQGCLAQVPGSRLVLALDEFGGALDSYKKGFLEYRFFTYWKDLVSEIPELSLILVLPTSAHTVLSSTAFNNLFSFAESFAIEFLDHDSAERLLTIPLQAQQIVMHPSVAAYATALTGCNPYYTALIGLHVFNYLDRESLKQYITHEDINIVVEDIMKLGSNLNFDLYEQEVQNEDEWRILHAFVELTTQTKQSTIPLKKLSERLAVPSSSIRPHLERLRSGLVLNEENSTPRNPRYSFKIELLRHWLIRNEWFFLKH